MGWEGFGKQRDLAPAGFKHPPWSLALGCWVVWCRAVLPPAFLLLPAPARSRDFSPAQRTLTLPEGKGARDGLDFLIGRTPGGSAWAPNPN